jgi:hypothetical protein
VLPQGNHPLAETLCFSGDRESHSPPGGRFMRLTDYLLALVDTSHIKTALAQVGKNYAIHAIIKTIY